MEKKERLKALRKTKEKTWYGFCMFQAMNEPVVKKTREHIACEMEMTLPTLRRYLLMWEELGLIRFIDDDGGILIAQFDDEPTEILFAQVERKYRVPVDVLDLWKVKYSEHYSEECRLGHMAKAVGNAKRILTYTDEEIENTFDTVLMLYDRKWKTSQYPRPTVGALSTWLFDAARPFIQKKPQQEFKSNVTPVAENLLGDLESKGWI